MNSKTRIGIIGATGYVGLELITWLAGHPNFDITCVASHTHCGERFADFFPAFRGLIDLDFIEPDPRQIAEACDCCVTALPHGVSSVLVPQLLALGLTVLDHSGDFRFKDQAVYEAAYHLQHPCPELLQTAVYGLPELHRQQLAGCRLIANPGCYPTGTILAAWPLLAAGLIEPDSLIADAVSGISGSGRKAGADYNYCELAENYKPYGVTRHRHLPEMEQELSLAAGQAVTLSFTPHLAPMKRGMLITLYARPNAAGRRELEQTTGDAFLYRRFAEHYKNEPFIRVLRPGQLPATSQVAGSNFLDLVPVWDGHSGVIKVFSALDNLGKGAASQAVQALNICLGYPETAGLSAPGRVL
ncbi:MAG: N-acetyl-gamma-glutamyl-phosphate reductase [Oscillospiraceae bacterium]|nr:N-acetyl-gamma-glutamyl-phosphate reductase [Oscillospiraceae bacterium]MDD4367793.1 N-acetyl-gamma-glutamyl-phosphate reductase [Oscillospiraceae bacterium]